MKQFLTTLTFLAGVMLSMPAAQADPNACYPHQYAALDANGKEFTAADFQGAPTLLYFGYATCPSACPTTMANLTNWLHDLGPAANNIRVVFVSVDPGADTAAAMQTFLKPYDKRIRGLLPNLCNLQTMEHAFKASHDTTRLPGKAPLITHSTNVFLLDKTGAVVGKITEDEKDASAMAKIKALAAQ